MLRVADVIAGAVGRQGSPSQRISTTPDESTYVLIDAARAGWHTAIRGDVAQSQGQVNSTKVTISNGASGMVGPYRVTVVSIVNGTATFTVAPPES